MSNIVTFEQAKMLRELGFNWECIYWYNENGTKECPIEQGYMEYYYEVDCFLNDWNAQKIDRDLYGSYPPKVSYSAPTVSEALDYLREEKGIECGIFPIMQPVRDGLKMLMYGYRAYDLDKNCKRIHFDLNFATSDYPHPLAESALLTAVLDYLDKKGGAE